jgi:hypothetical protein
MYEDISIKYFESHDLLALLVVMSRGACDRLQHLAGPTTHTAGSSTGLADKMWVSLVGTALALNVPSEPQT